jgi:hypothetical protein
VAMGFRYTGGIRMKKFEGWRKEELQYVATLIAGRDMTQQVMEPEVDLYAELVREIRNRRIKEELFQMKLKVTDESE